MLRCLEAAVEADDVVDDVEATLRRLESGLPQVQPREGTGEILTCCTPAGPPTTEFLRDCHKHSFAISPRRAACNEACRKGLREQLD
jgi:hypothetical protein